MSRMRNLPLVPHPLNQALQQAHDIRILRPLVDDGRVTLTNRFTRVQSHASNVCIRLDSGADVSLVTPAVRRLCGPIESLDCMALEVLLPSMQVRFLLLEVSSEELGIENLLIPAVENEIPGTSDPMLVLGVDCMARTFSSVMFDWANETFNLGERDEYSR